MEESARRNAINNVKIENIARKCVIVCVVRIPLTSSVYIQHAITDNFG